MRRIALFILVSCFLILGSSCSKGGKRQITVFDNSPDTGESYSDDEGYAPSSGDYGQITLYFSNPVIKLSDFDEMTNSLSQKLKIAINPSLKYEVRPIDEQSAAVIFMENLKDSTKYTMKILETIKDLDGKSVVTSINGTAIHNEYEFMTRRIQVTSCYANGKFLDSTVGVRFTTPVDLAELTRNLDFTSSSGATVKYRLEYAVITNSRESNDVILNIIRTNQRMITIIPNKLDKATRYSLTIRKGLMPSQGNLDLEKDYDYSFETFMPLEYRELRTSDYDWEKKTSGYYPDSSYIMVFNNELDTRVSLNDKVKVEPKVENLTFSYSMSNVILNGNFIGGQKYTIRILPGLKDIYGQEYRQEAIASFETEHGLSYFGMPYGYMVMENYLPPILPFKVRNIGTIDFSYLYLSDLNEIARYLSQKKKDRSAYFTENKKSKELKIDWSWDKYYNYRLDLNKMKASKSGLMVYKASPALEVTDSRTTNIDRGGMILFTDLGVTAKSGPDETVVFVRKLSDNSPVPGANVYELLTGDNPSAELRGKTDSRGICRLTNNSRIPLIAVENNGNISLNYGESSYSYEYEDSYYGSAGPNIVYYGDQYYAHETRMLLFTERYLYKPGDQVDVKGIVRYRMHDNWSAAADIDTNNNFPLRIQNSRGEEITNFTLQSDNWGSLHFKFKIPSNAPTGYYRIDSDRTGGIEFSVQDFKPARAEMRIRPAKDTFKWGDQFQSDVIGWYLFGAPVLRPIKYSVSVSPLWYYSTRFPDYSFSSVWWDDNGRRDNSFTLVSGTAFPDKDGRIKISRPLRKDDFKGDAQIQLSADTTLDDASTVYGSKSGIALYNPVHVGIKINNYFVNAGSGFYIGLIALDEKENVAENQDVTLEIEKREWKSYQKAGVNGRLEWQWELQKTTVVNQSEKIGKKDVYAAVKTPGYYIARVKTYIRGHESVSESSFYAIGQGDYGWKVDNDYRITLESDKKEYQVGDTAKILVQNPFKKALALVTIEREKIHSIQQIEVKDSMAVISVPVTKEMIPNAYVSVMLFTGRSGTNQVKNDEDLARPNYRIGYADLKIIPKEKKLQILVKTDKDKYKPGETAKVTIEVKDNGGGSVKDAEVTLSVVDKGILNLVNYELPNPLDYFYGPRQLAIYTSEMREFVYGQRYLSEKGEIIGGDGNLNFGMLGVGMLSPRQNFKSTAYYNDKLWIKKGKPAVFTFQVPDNLTTWKIMAVAQTRDSSFGYGDGALVVNKPVMVLSGLPGFVRIGDQIEAGAVIYNYTGSDGNFTVNLTCDQKLDVTGSLTTNVVISNNNSREVRFKFNIPSLDTENLKFTVTAKSGWNADGLVETAWIRQPKLYETTAVYRKADNSTSEKFSITANTVPNMGRIEANVSPSAFTELKGNVDYLVHYPYGCLEQKSSSILPLILGEDIIIKQGLLKFKSSQELRDVVQTVINEFPKYLGNKSYKYWPDYDYEPNQYLTVYATFVLTMAKKNGYQIPEGLYEKSVNWALQYAEGNGDKDYNHFDQYDTLTRAFALYVSAMNGRQSIQNLRSVYLTVKDSYSDNIPALAYMLKTVSLYKDFEGKKDMLKTLREKILSRARIDSHSAYFTGFDNWGWFYYSPVISTAIALQALIESGIEFKDAYKSINWLILARKAEYWESTHENAMVYWAFNSYLEKYEKDDPNFTAQIKIKGAEILKAAFTSRKDKMMSAEYALKSVSTGDLKVDVIKEGKGPLYYQLKYQYLLKNYPARRDAGFSVEKRVFDYDTDKEIKDNQYIRGKRYVVKITVSTPKERNFAVLDDQLPAGLVPVNLDFATEKNEKGVQTGEKSGYWYSWGEFDHHEQYRDRVLFTAMQLSAGRHELKYVVRAVTLGQFQAPHTKAEEMYHPDVFGYVRQDAVLVKEK